MMRATAARLFAAAALAGGAARAADGVVFEVERPDSLRLFLRDASGRNYGSLEAVDAAVKAGGHRLVFAMNAGMYEADRSPSGLFVQDGLQRAPLDARQLAQDGRTPNFHLRPNGVFAVSAAGPAIIATTDYARSPPPGVTLATQSGPLLLVRGAMVAPAVAHGTDAPANRHPRNAICVDGARVRLVEVDAMTLHQFAVHLRDVVHCSDALYMDGVISVALDTRSGRRDPVPAQAPLGPIIGVVAP